MDELEFHFRIGLRRIIIDSRFQEALIKSYDLTSPDENIRHKLLDKVKAGMVSPQKTGSYQGARGYGRLSEEVALQSAELTGLIMLVFLGEKNVIPTLLKQLREDKTGNTRRQTVAGLALRYATRQDIGEHFFFKQEIDAWERWWEQNKL